MHTQEMFEATKTRIQMGSLVISGKIFPLYKGLNLIGRSKQATVVLKNESISQHQAIITIIDENQHFLSDVLSSNGTVLHNNKLHPLEMYELEQDSVIAFARVLATYNKVPGELNNTPTLLHTDIGALQNTQQVDDSFYSANTQAIDDTHALSTSVEHHNGYFDDGYDFNNLPSPPDVTISPSQTEISIHDMPTQVYEVVDINNPEGEIEIAHTGRHLTIHDLATQLLYHTSHDTETKTSLSPQLSIHFEPTQLLNQVENEDLDDMVVPQTQESPRRVDEQVYFNASEGVVDQTLINDSGIVAGTSKMQLQTNSLCVIDTTPGKETVGKSILDNISKHLPDDDVESDESQEIIQHEKKCRPLDKYSDDYSESRGLSDNDICLTVKSQSQEIGFKKKSLRPIDSDSDGASDKAAQVNQNIEKARKLSSDSDINENDDLRRNETLDKHEDTTKIDSDCETDMELENDTNCENKAKDSGSETDIETELSPVCDQLTSISNTTSLSDTKRNQEILSRSKNCESNNETKVDMQSSNDETLFTHTSSDDDSDDFNLMPENTSININNTRESVSDGVSQKLTELRQSILHDCSEESIHFGLTDLENTDDIANAINDSVTIRNVTGASAEVDKTIIVPEKIQPNIDEDNDDRLNKNNDLDTNENLDVQEITQKEPITTSELGVRGPILQEFINDTTDDIFMQPTQQLVARSVEIGQELQHKEDTIFDEDTQLNKTNESDILQPTQELVVAQTNTLATSKTKRSSTKNLFTTSTPANLNEDDIFLQPTQKIDFEKLDNTNKHEFLKPLAGSLVRNGNSFKLPNDDDVFLQPTQKLSSQETENAEVDDDIFLQPTQELNGADLNSRTEALNLFNAFERKMLVVNQNIFRNSARLRFNNNTSSVEGEGDDIFLQPTQLLITENPSTASNRNDDSHARLTQLDTEENIFYQPTQAIEMNSATVVLGEDSMNVVKDNLQLNSDKTNNGTRSSLSLLHKSPEELNKDEEDESQLEVLFASQTVKFSSHVNTRPRNPLVNVLEKSDDEYEEEDCLESTRAMNSKTLEYNNSLENNNRIEDNGVSEDQTRNTARKKLDTNSKSKSNRQVVVEIDVLLGKKNTSKNTSTKTSANVGQLKTPINLNKRARPFIPNSNVDADADNEPLSKAKTSEKHTRLTRNRHQNLETEHVTDAQTSTNTRKTKKDNQSYGSKTKRSKFDEHGSETPLISTTAATRRGRKLDLSHKIDVAEPVASSNKRKPRGNESPAASIITISSTDDSVNDDSPTTSKRRKQDTAIHNVVGTRQKRKELSNINNEVNGTIKPKQKQVKPKNAESTEDLQKTSSPEKRRASKPKVVFTMLDDPKLESLIRSLGGTMVDTVKYCTVLVTGNLRRSQKLLSAVGEAKPICGPDWIHASKKAGTFLDPWDHLLCDKEAESKWNFTLKESLNRSSNNKLLANKSFQILTTTNTDVLKAAIESCGGKLLTRLPAKQQSDIIIIGSPEGRNKYLKLLRKKPPLKVVAAEAVFDGVLRQELHWDDHLLS